MRISQMTCPSCGQKFVVDLGLLEVGTIRVRCIRCEHYFLPPGASASRTIEDLANANVDIDLWEPPNA